MRPDDLDRARLAVRAAAPGPPRTAEQYAERLAARTRARRQSAYLARLHATRKTNHPKEASNG